MRADYPQAHPHSHRHVLVRLPRLDHVPLRSASDVRNHASEREVRLVIDMPGFRAR